MTTYFVQPLHSVNRAFAGLERAHNPVRVITALEGAQQIPLFTVIPRTEGFPLSVEFLTDNFAALLNDAKPPHRIVTEGLKIYYRPLPTGVSLHYRGSDGGVSREGLLFTVSDKASSQALGERAVQKLTPAFMKKLCDAIEMDGPAAGQPGVQPANPAP